MPHQISPIESDEAAAEALRIVRLLAGSPEDGSSAG